MNQSEQVSISTIIYASIVTGIMNRRDLFPPHLNFGKTTFKVGSDPFSIYQTLTRGYGSMPPQVNLTPVEKYDLIIISVRLFYWKRIRINISI
jgi:hypothetical protein